MATATVTAKNGLNVRSGAGTSYSKLGALPYNKTVTVTGQKNGWYSINYSGKVGYICGSYVNYSGGSTSSGGSSGSTTSSGGTYTVTASALNVRKGPGTSNAILGTLSNGAVVTASGESNGWLKITYKGQTGWISKKYTKSGGSTSGSGGSSGSGSSTTAKSGTVTCSALNVRKGPSTSYGKIGSLSNGYKFSYTEESNGWLKISYQGQKGWISKSYTSVGGGGSSNTGGSSSGSGTQKQRQLGQSALAQARSLYSRAVNEGWKYNQNKRLTDGDYDCAAYSCRAWKEGTGINPGGNSEGQAIKLYNAGGQVSYSNMIAGDLIFYAHNWNSGARWRGINHVAVYDGNGGTYDAGGTPIKHKSSYKDGTQVMACRPSVLA